MTTTRQIFCIHKDAKLNPYERITSIGGQDANGGQWRLTQKEAIAGIERGDWSFFVMEGNKRVEIEVAESSMGHKYLRTKPDHMQQNNLLNLSECVRIRS
jgi:hypothetical protein